MTTLPIMVQAIWQCHCPDADPVVECGEVDIKDPENSIECGTDRDDAVGSARDPLRGPAIVDVDSIVDMEKDNALEKGEIAEPRTPPGGIYQWLDRQFSRHVRLR